MTNVGGGIPITFNSDGTKVAMTSSDEYSTYGVRIWDTETGAEISRLATEAFRDGEQALRAFEVTFSSDDTRVITISGDTVRVWLIEGGVEIASLSNLGRGVEAAWFTPDEKRVLTRDNKSVRTWAIDSEIVLALIRARTRECLPEDFRRSVLGEPRPEAQRRREACETCLPVFFERLGDASKEEWEIYVESWRAYDRCLEDHVSIWDRLFIR